MRSNTLPTRSVLIPLILLLFAACTSDKPGGAAPLTEPAKPQALTLVPESSTARPPAALPAPNEADRLRQTHEMKMVRRESVAGMVPHADIRDAIESHQREVYGHFDDNPLKLASETPVSTFSIDVDTGAYANVRRFLNLGQLPVKDAVRVEEMLNYFTYDYPLPTDVSRPFSVTTDIAPSPWNADTLLLRVGLKGYDVAPDKLPPANLVFLVDVSGSMMPPERLPLLKSGLKLLIHKLRAQDRVSVVVYAGASGIVLEPTPGNQQAKIIAALDRLSAGGSTNGASGIHLAYTVAQQAFIPNGINRVLLATDGDFNVGTVNFDALKNLIEEKRKTGISLTTLGFGVGNYNERLMEQLADAGNGNYAYIDTLNEAHKVLVSEMTSTLQTIAKDVKIQIEFNPAIVAEYRLIGYENRHLAREDFNNDNVDAGDIGAGHSVTALYEVALTNRRGQRVDPLRYGRRAAVTEDAKNNEFAWLRLRFKQPNTVQSQLIEQPIRTSDIKEKLTDASADFRFAAAVAGFGQLLRGGKYTGQFTYSDVLTLAQNARGNDAYGYRGEFLSLVNLARAFASAPTRDAARGGDRR